MTKTNVQDARAPAAGRGEGTRRRLVAAAIELVAESGWERVTTRQIADRAGANQALINYHFGSKDGLLRAALEAAIRREFAAPVRAMLDATSFVDGAAALIRQLAEIDEAEPIVRFSMEALAQAPRDEEVRRVMADLLAELRATLAVGIATAQRRGEIDPRLDPHGSAALLGAALDGLALHLLIDPSLDAAPAAAAVAGFLRSTKEKA